MQIFRSTYGLYRVSNRHSWSVSLSLSTIAACQQNVDFTQVKTFINIFFFFFCTWARQSLSGETKPGRIAERRRQRRRRRLAIIFIIILRFKRSDINVSRFTSSHILQATSRWPEPSCRLPHTALPAGAIQVTTTITTATHCGYGQQQSANTNTNASFCFASLTLWLFTLIFVAFFLTFFLFFLYFAFCFFGFLVCATIS